MSRPLKVGDKVGFNGDFVKSPSGYTVVEVGLYRPKTSGPSIQIVRVKWDSMEAYPDWYSADKFPLVEQKYELVRVITADSLEHAKMIAAMAGATEPPVTFEVREVK